MRGRYLLGTRRTARHKIDMHGRHTVHTLRRTAGPDVDLMEVQFVLPVTEGRGEHLAPQTSPSRITTPNTTQHRESNAKIINLFLQNRVDERQ